MGHREGQADSRGLRKSPETWALKGAAASSTIRKLPCKRSPPPTITWGATVISCTSWHSCHHQGASQSESHPHHGSSQTRLILQPPRLAVGRPGLSSALHWMRLPNKARGPLCR